MDASFGGRVALLRKAQDLSQGDLGERVGRSQATISRLERASEVPDDLRLLGKLARALDTSLQDLLGDFDPPTPDWAPDDDQTFFAFCPNPFCDSNSVRREGNGNLSVRWSSGSEYILDVKNEVNFCERCGEDLIKDCSECGRPITSSKARYCRTCGTQLNTRPTDEEWVELRKKYPPPTEPDDDLPF